MCTVRLSWLHDIDPVCRSRSAGSTLLSECRYFNLVCASTYVIAMQDTVLRAAAFNRSAVRRAAAARVLTLHVAPLAPLPVELMQSVAWQSVTPERFSVTGTPRGLPAESNGGSTNFQLGKAFGGMTGPLNASECPNIVNCTGADVVGSSARAGVAASVEPLQDSGLVEGPSKSRSGSEQPDISSTEDAIQPIDRRPATAASAPQHLSDEPGPQGARLTRDAAESAALASQSAKMAQGCPPLAPGIFANIPRQAEDVPLPALMRQEAEGGVVLIEALIRCISNRGSLAGRGESASAHLPDSEGFGESSAGHDARGNMAAEQDAEAQLLGLCRTIVADAGADAWLHHHAAGQSTGATLSLMPEGCAWDQVRHGNLVVCF